MWYNPEELSKGLEQLIIGAVVVIVGTCLACFACACCLIKCGVCADKPIPATLTNSQGVEMKVILYKDAIDSGIIKDPSQVVELSGDVIEQSSL